jgi:hypothetical protein
MSFSDLSALQKKLNDDLARLLVPVVAALIICIDPTPSTRKIVIKPVFPDKLVGIRWMYMHLYGELEGEDS